METQPQVDCNCAYKMASTIICKTGSSPLHWTAIYQNLFLGQQIHGIFFLPVGQRIHGTVFDVNSLVHLDVIWPSKILIE